MTAVKVSGAAGGPPAARETGPGPRRGRKRSLRNAGPDPAWATATSERGQALPPPQLCALSARFPSRCPDLGPRGAQFRQPRGEPQLASPLPRTAEGQGGGGGAHFSRIPRAHGHGRSGHICQPWAPRPPLVTHRRAGRASGPAGQHPVAASSRQSALPRRAPAAAPSLAPPPSVNTVAARPPRPDAQVETGGTGCHWRPRPAGCPRPAPPRRAPTPRPAPGSRDACWRRQRARRTKPQSY